jgi:hypothetical protein
MSGLKIGVSEAILAYLKADRAANAAMQRRMVLDAGLTADAEHQALLKIEDSLEAAAKNMATA